MRKKYLIIIFIIIIAASCSEVKQQPPKQTVRSEIEKDSFSEYWKKILEKVPDSTNLYIQKLELTATDQIKNFYKSINYNSFWTKKNKPTQFSDELIKLIEKSHYYGLDSNAYLLPKLRTLYFVLNDTNWNTDRMKLSAEYEAIFTNTCLKFMSNLNRGRTYPDTLIYGFYIKEFTDTFFTYLNSAYKKDSVTPYILNVQPKHPEYVLLQKALVKFIDNNKISKRRIYVPNYETDSSRCYNKAKKILRESDYIKTHHVNYELYAKHKLNEITKIPYQPNKVKFSYMAESKSDSTFIYSLKLFQMHHGLNPDGKIGKYTHQSLQKTNYDRLQQIYATLERMRWESFWDNNHILVNIPSYKLKIYDQDSLISTHKVVVGSIRNATPTLSSIIEYFIINPEWHVPFSISSKELLPKLRRDSSYLRRNNYRLINEHREAINAEAVNWKSVSSGDFNYRIVQSSGRSNALGIVKFIFPNPYSVYIHDTPQKRYFNYDIRAYSHGCMRLHQPIDFAKYLLSREEDKSLRDSLEIKLKSRKKKYYYMSKPIQVHVRYYTCEGTPDGDVIFYKDIYSKNDDLIKKLFNKTKKNTKIKRKRVEMPLAYNNKH